MAKYAIFAGFSPNEIAWPRPARIIRETGKYLVVALDVDTEATAEMVPSDIPMTRRVIDQSRTNHQDCSFLGRLNQQGQGWTEREHFLRKEAVLFVTRTPAMADGLMNLIRAAERVQNETLVLFRRAFRLTHEERAILVDAVGANEADAVGRKLCQARDFACLARGYILQEAVRQELCRVMGHIGPEPFLSNSSLNFWETDYLNRVYRWLHYLDNMPHVAQWRDLAQLGQEQIDACRREIAARGVRDVATEGWKVRIPHPDVRAWLNVHLAERAEEQRRIEELQRQLRPAGPIVGIPEAQADFGP